MQRLQFKSKSKLLLTGILLLLILVILAHKTDPNGALAQGEYNYSITTPFFPNVTSDTYTKSQGNLDTLTVGAGIAQTASIGRPAFKLFGWGPPDTLVRVNAVGVSDSTYSNSSGYFEFTNLYLPTNLFSKLANAHIFPEVCVQAVSGKATSQPTCIPAFEVNKLVNDIGPVLLSPILIAEKNTAKVGEQVVVRGKTVPLAQTKVYFSNTGFWNSFSLVKKANAAWLPEYNLVADESGDFEFNLPTTQNSAWKVFATAKILDSNSPKGTTLNFLVIGPFWAWILEIIGAFGRVKYGLFPVVVLCEVVIIILLANYLKGKPKHHKKVI